MNWSSELTATFAAAALSALIGAASIVTTILEARASRRSTELGRDREHAWLRWAWTMEKSLSQDPDEAAMGRAMMNAILEMNWSTDDERLSLAVDEAREAADQGRRADETQRRDDAISTQ